MKLELVTSGKLFEATPLEKYGAKEVYFFDRDEVTYPCSSVGHYCLYFIGVYLETNEIPYEEAIEVRHIENVSRDSVLYINTYDINNYDKVTDIDNNIIFENVEHVDILELLKKSFIKIIKATKCTKK